MQGLDQQGHPIIRAKEEDYPEFKGEWATITAAPGKPSIQRYVEMQGVQLAAAGLKMALLVPFTTMAAINTPKPSTNMFAESPVETIASVLQAIQSNLAQHPVPMPTLAKLGAASYSSGISALRSFLRAMQSFNLVKEVIDLDSPAIIRERPPRLTPSPGAISKCFTQIPSPGQARTYVTLIDKHFQNITLDTGIIPQWRRIHALIGTRMYCGAMVNSAIK